MAANGSSARLNAAPFPSGSPRRLGHFYLLPNSVKFYIDLSLLFKDIDCVLLLYCLLAAFPRAVYLLPCTTTHGKAPNRSLPLLFAPAFRTTLFFFFFCISLLCLLVCIPYSTTPNQTLSSYWKFFLPPHRPFRKSNYPHAPTWSRMVCKEKKKKKKKLWLHPHLVLCFFSLANGLSYILL